jgi:hypothetical protein
VRVSNDELGVGEDFGAMAGGFRITAVAFDGDRTLVKVRSSARDG